MGTHRRTTREAIAPRKASPVAPALHHLGAGTSPAAAGVGTSSTTTGGRCEHHDRAVDIGGIHPSGESAVLPGPAVGWNQTTGNPASTGAPRRRGGDRQPRSIWVTSSPKCRGTWTPRAGRASGNAREWSERVRAGGPKGVRGMEAARYGNSGTDRRVRITESYRRSPAAPSGASTPPGQRTPTASTLCERVYK